MSDATQSQSNSSFDPEALRILSMALDDAWTGLKTPAAPSRGPLLSGNHSQLLLFGRRPILTH